jgi:hypothetical protein
MQSPQKDWPGWPGREVAESFWIWKVETSPRSHRFLGGIKQVTNKAFNKGIVICWSIQKYHFPKKNLNVGARGRNHHRLYLFRRIYFFHIK